MKTCLISLTTVVLALTAGSTLHASSAHDDASQSPYADGWDDGDNGGTGFGPWSLSFDGDASALHASYSSDPHFIDGVGIGPLGANLLGAPAFGLTSDSSTANVAEATRSFSEPMKINQTFKVEIDGSALEGDPRIGNAFELMGADGVPRYTLRTSLGSADDHWTVNGLDTDIPAGDAFSLSFTLTAVDTYSASIFPHVGGFGLFTLNASLGGTAGEDITGIRARTFGTGSSADGARELFFDNLELTRVNVPEPTTLVLAAAILGIGLNMRRR